jgi:hypothetical protein
MNKWRPEGWKTGQVIDPAHDHYGYGYENGYETGADAMLEALRKEGTKVDAGTPSGTTLSFPTFVVRPPGVMVFIPDDKEDPHGQSSQRTA